MFDIGWSEMAVIALIALLIVGPKQLPQAMRTFASFSKTMRRYAQDFRSGVDNIIREAELEDAKKALDGVRKANPKTAIKELIDPTGEVTDEIKSVESEAKDKGETKADKGTGTGTATSTGDSGKTVERKALSDGTVTGAVGAAGAAASAGKSVKGGGSESDEKAEKAEKPAGRKVTQPVQMAPPNSIRPPVEPAKATADKATSPTKKATPKKKTATKKVATKKTAPEPAAAADTAKAEDTGTKSGGSGSA